MIKHTQMLASGGFSAKRVTAGKYVNAYYLRELSYTNPPDWVVDAIEKYLAALVNMCPDIHNSIYNINPASPDFIRIDKLAHQLRLSSSAIGAFAMSELMSDITCASEQGDVAGLRGLGGSIRKIQKGTVHEIELFLHTG